jgi:hypothetical protein
MRGVGGTSSFDTMVRSSAIVNKKVDRVKQLVIAVTEPIHSFVQKRP